MDVVSRINFKTLVAGGICLLGLAGLIALGFWQLDRADQKKALIELLEVRHHQTPVRLNHSRQGLENLLYRRVFVSGVYDFRHQFLLDNQVIDGQIGAYVLTPLKIDGAPQSVLINRGWVPMNGRRNIVGDLEILESHVTVNGMVKNFPGVGLKLQDAAIPSGGWPGWIQWVDPQTLAGVLGYPLLPYQILLNADDESGFLRKWQITYPVSPEKHLAYAVQWFALAAALVILLAWRIRSRD